MSILYVSCIKFPTNQFVRNLCSILFASLNKLIFHLLHNLRSSITNDHCLIEQSGFGLPKEKEKRKKESKCSEILF
jgi:hypothetical protein